MDGLRGETRSLAYRILLNRLIIEFRDRAIWSCKTRIDDMLVDSNKQHTQTAKPKREPTEEKGGNVF